MRVIRSIKRKLILALLLVLLPLIIIQGVTIQRWRAAREDAILAGRTDAAYVAGSTFNRYVMDIVHQNYAVATLLSTGGHPVDVVQFKKILLRLKSRSKTIVGYAVTDSTGKVLVSDPPIATGQTLGDREYFQQLKAGKEWAISDMVIGRLVKVPTFIIASAITGDKGQFNGIVLAGVDVNKLHTIMPSKFTEGEIVLIDKNGRLVFDSSAKSIDWKDRDWSRDSLVKSAISGRMVTSDSHTSPITKKEVMGSYVPTNVAGWVAGSFTPVNDAMAPVIKWTRALLASSGLVVLASILLIWFLGTYLTKPVLRLTDATTGFAAGENLPPVHLRTGDELQALAEAFNEMKDRIADRESRLSTLAEICEQAFQDAAIRAAELEAVLESISIGVIIAEGREGKIVRVNPAAERLYGMPAPPNIKISEYVTVLKLFRPSGEVYPAEELPLSRAIAEGCIVTDEEIAIIRPDGTEIIVLATASPIRNEMGYVTGAVAAFQDITILKQAEARQRTIAEALQDSLLPELPTQCGRLQISSKYVAALDEARVGGDFQDVFEVSPGKIAVVIGDVSGKGLSAAVDLAMTKYYIRSYSYEHPDNPEEVLKLVNTALLRNDTPERFVTAFMAIIDGTDGTMIYANAGHEPVLIQHASKTDFEELWPTGLALGVDGSESYDARSTKINPTDLMVLYTDGVTEARSPEGEMLNFEGLKSMLARIGPSVAGSASDDIFEAVREYTGGQLRDDLALLAVSIG